MASKTYTAGVSLQEKTSWVGFGGFGERVWQSKGCLSWSLKRREDFAITAKMCMSVKRINGIFGIFSLPCTFLLF